MTSFHEAQETLPLEGGLPALEQYRTMLFLVAGV
jgi:hypothetical protein